MVGLTGSDAPPRTVGGIAQAGREAAAQRYATLLQWGARFGMAVLLASFALQLSGLMPARLPPETLVQLWDQPLQVYLQHSGAPTGWQWVALLHHGDVLGLAGIAVLAGCSGICLAALLPLYRAQRDRVYFALCMLQLLVLGLAASGWLSGGHG